MGEAEERVTGWFAGRIPQDWFEGPPEIAVDREEILIVGRLADVEAGKDATDAQRAEARSGRIKQFREDTRERRMRIAREAEHRFHRKVSWGVEIGGDELLFTNAAVPVMTRLRMPERHVLDTLIDAGVARSRSEALAWCVRLVGQHEEEWIRDLQDALVKVREVRAEGPQPA